MSEYLAQLNRQNKVKHQAGTTEIAPVNERVTTEIATDILLLAESDYFIGELHIMKSMLYFRCVARGPIDTWMQQERRPLPSATW
jgi:hypothetical protein